MAIKIAIFASGSGSNFEALVRAINRGELKAECAGLIADKKNAFALDRAERLGIEAHFINPKEYSDKAGYEEAILKQLKTWNVEYIVLAGYMRLIGSTLLSAYPKRIINIHPSLLPKYKGKDALGQALAQKEKTVGISVHYVDEGMDTGEIIEQFAFDINPEVDRHQIEEVLHAHEHVFYTSVLNKLWKEQTK